MNVDMAKFLAEIKGFPSPRGTVEFQPCCVQWLTYVCAENRTTFARAEVEVLKIFEPDP